MYQEFKLKYGDGSLSLKVPAANVQEVVEVPQRTSAADNRSVLREALAGPLDAPPLTDFAENKKVLLLVEDATREIPQEDLLTALAPSFQSARSAVALICTGTHSPDAPGNEKIVGTIRQAFADRGISAPRIVVHNALQPPFSDHGITSFGNQLLVNPVMDEAEVFVVLSDMKNHYFAGYSNPIKNFMPGAAAFQTVEKNHAMALMDEATFGRHPWHPDPGRRNNPLSNEMGEAYGMIVRERPVWALATICKGSHILWCRAGDARSVTREGIRRVDQWMGKEVKPADLLIVSPGGYPNDESLYTAQRALELSKAAVKSGGKVLFLAQCRNGIGPPRSVENFYRILTHDLTDVLQVLHRDYFLYAHKAYKFARMIQGLNFLGVVSELSDETLRNIHLTPVADLQKLLNEWIRSEPQIKINVVKDGNKIALYRKSGNAV